MAKRDFDLFCNKCKKTRSGDHFYMSNNKEKYPNGYIDMCKDCATMHIDNYDSNTYLWLLKECDVPYVPEEWFKLIEKYSKQNTKMTGLTIIGRYLASMKLKQYRDYRWDDTEFIQKLKKSKTEEVMKSQGYGVQDIKATLADMDKLIPCEAIMENPPPQEETIVIAEKNSVTDSESIPEEAVPIVEDYFAKVSGGENDFTDELTEEDKKYLRLKWGKSYKPEEWIRLEQLYEEMMASYDIQGAGHVDTLKLICKTSLKANQLIDVGDVEGFQKMSKVYDNLMKSGKFTAAQNKSENGEFIDSISELVELCEKEGFIPRFYIDQPNDQVDATLQDLKNYTHSLVTEEMNLGSLIENAVKEMAKQEAKEEDNDVDMNELSYDNIESLMDEDFVEIKELVEEEVALDEKLLQSLKEEF